MSRLDDLIHFYDLVAILENKLARKLTLENCDGRMCWPLRGVYFFFEQGEERNQTGIGPRVVRVGTHALRNNSRTTLWHRLSQHKGTVINGSGNHRCSIFRSHVGSAILQLDSWSIEIKDTWGRGANAPRETRLLEKSLEQFVSIYIRKMPFLCLEVNDTPGPESLRGVIESDSIALLSNYNSTNDPIDPPCPTWLGHSSKSEKVRKSGLWNSDHVMDKYDPDYLLLLEQLIDN